MPISHAHSQRAAPPLTKWERAYQAFETPEEELRKFVGRLRGIGVESWNRQSRILEVCSGRGTGLRAWHELGFTRIVGVDFSAALVLAQRGPGSRVIGDARALPVRDGSIDIAVVQGGLHHLFTSADVDAALGEMRRVVVRNGRIVIIEPWLTPFLRVVHAVSEQPAVRRISAKVDALATMIEEERETYDRWLNAPDEHLQLIRRHVVPHSLKRRWGKLVLVGSPA